MVLLVASQYALPGYGDRRVWGSRPSLARSLCQVIVAYALRLNSPAGTEGSTVSSLIFDRWLMLGSETLSISRWMVAYLGYTLRMRTLFRGWPIMVNDTHTRRRRMTLFTRTAKLDPGAHGAKCVWAVAVHHAVGISCQRNSGYRPSRVNIMAQGLSTPDPSLSPTHLSIRRGRATTTHYTHHQVSLVVSHNTTLIPSLGLRIGPACEAGLSVGMRRERVPPQRIKIKIKIKKR